MLHSASTPQVWACSIFNAAASILLSLRFTKSRGGFVYSNLTIIHTSPSLKSFGLSLALSILSWVPQSCLSRNVLFDVLQQCFRYHGGVPINDSMHVRQHCPWWKQSTEHNTESVYPSWVILYMIINITMLQIMHIKLLFYINPESNYYFGVHGICELLFCKIELTNYYFQV